MSRFRRAKAGDRVHLPGTIESVRDGLVIVRVDHAAAHAVPQEWGLIVLPFSALEPEGPLVWQRPLERQQALRARSCPSCHAIGSNPQCPDDWHEQ